MRYKLILCIGLLYCLSCQSQVMDTIIINCPPRNEHFVPGPMAVFTLSTDVPELTKKELRKLKKMEPYVTPDSLLKPFICDSILNEKHNSNYYLKVFDSNNILRHEGFYRGYHPAGNFISYYRNGQPLLKGEYKIETINSRSKSIPIGRWITYRISGSINKIEDK